MPWPTAVSFHFPIRTVFYWNFIWYDGDIGEPVMIFEYIARMHAGNRRMTFGLWFDKRFQVVLESHLVRKIQMLPQIAFCLDIIGKVCLHTVKYSKVDINRKRYFL